MDTYMCNSLAFPAEHVGLGLGQSMDCLRKAQIYHLRRAIHGLSIYREWTLVTNLVNDVCPTGVNIISFVLYR